MPLTPKDLKIMASMVERYGPKRGKQVFYASATKGTLGRDMQARHGVGQRKDTKHSMK